MSNFNKKLLKYKPHGGSTSMGGVFVFFLLFAFLFLLSSVAANAATIQASLTPNFQADLTNTLVLQKGAGLPAFSRSTTAYQTDFEGKLNQVLSGEARFQGARRVQNLLTGSSENYTNASWTSINLSMPAQVLTANTTDTAAPNGLYTATKIVQPAGNTNYSMTYENLGANTMTQGTVSVWMKGAVGGEVAHIGMEVGGTSEVGMNPTLTTAWKRYSFSFNVANSQYLKIGADFRWGAMAGPQSAQTIYVWGAQVENTMGQSNTNPSEYVSVGVLPAPYHGAGVDGVQYFNTLNGNTVSSNVVTAGTGAKITSAAAAAAGGVTAGVVDATGPLGYLAEGARTNTAGGSNSFADNTYWGGAADFTITTATSIFSGQTAYKNQTNGAGSRSRYENLGPFVNGQTDTFSAIVENVDASRTDIGIYDGTGGAWLTLAQFTWATHTISMTIGSGNAGAQQLDATRWLIWINGTGTAAGAGAAGHIRQPNIYPAGIPANSNSIIIHYGAFEANASFPSSPIITTSGGTTRNADVLTYPTRGNISGTAATMYGEVTSNSTAPLIFATASNTFPLYWINSTTVRNSSSLTSLQLTYTPATLPFTTLQKVAVTYDTVANSRSLSGQGSVLSSGTIASGNYNPDATMAIGTNYSVAGSEVYGTIRNVKFWPKVLTNTQLANMTSTNNALARSVIPQTTTKTVNKTGLVAHWSFDDGFGTQAGDSSGNGLTGTLVSSPTWVTGKLGKALNFNGSSQYLSAAKPGALVSAISICLWAKWTTSNSGSTNDIQALVDNNHSGGVGVKGFIIQDRPDLAKIIQFSVHPDTNGVGSVAPYAVVGNGTWRHICGTNDGTTSTLYINGVYNNSTPETPDVYQPTITVGHWQSGARYFNGPIDDVRIYNRALSATEVSAIYNSTAGTINASTNTSQSSGLVGLWSFDGKDMNWNTNQALDISGAGNNGSLINMSTTSSPVIGKIGQALKFNGGTSYVMVPSTTSLKPTQITLCTWIKSNDYSTLTILAGKQRSSGGHGSYALVFRTGPSRITFTISDATPTEYHTTSTNMATGIWQHWCGTYDGLTQKLYLNGKIEDIQTPNITISNTDSYPLTIGSYYYPSPSSTLNGSLDDVRIYNRALSATEVKNLYNQGR